MPETPTAASSSMASSPSKSLTGNPLSYDAELKGMIEKLDGINNFRSFNRWKASFLKRFEMFLTQKGMGPAEASYTKFGTDMTQLEKHVGKVKTFLDKGDLSADRTTVKGRNALNEMNKSLVSSTQDTIDLIPSTGTDERRKMYNKYHLGCVLVRDGFSQYERMVQCNDAIQDMKNNGGLMQIADKQQLNAIEEYQQQLKRFVEVMNDLGLYEVMMKCRQFAHGEVDEIVLVDPKTGTVIELSRQQCLQLGVLTPMPDVDPETGVNANGQRFREEEISRVEKDEMRRAIKLAFAL